MLLYHYTKLENLTSIVQKEGLVFWLSEYKDLDDPTEGEYIIKVQQEYFPKWTNNNVERYVLSLCEQCDNLSMWREYANNASGIVIEIETERIKPSMFYNLVSCDYGTEMNARIKRDLETELQSISSKESIEKYKKTSERFPNLSSKEIKEFNEKMRVINASSKQLCVKSPYYSYEKEWRYIVKVSDISNFRYHFKGGQLKKSYEFRIQCNVLRKIYVGSNNSDKTIDEVKKYLNMVGYDDVPVEKIKLPYRSR